MQKRIKQKNACHIDKNELQCHSIDKDYQKGLIIKEDVSWHTLLEMAALCAGHVQEPVR